VFDGVVPANSFALEGEAYLVTTTGPFQCFRADLASVNGSSALLSATVDARYATGVNMG